MTNRDALERAQRAFAEIAAMKPSDNFHGIVTQRARVAADSIANHLIKTESKSHG